jgi:hypothetical protein
MDLRRHSASLPNSVQQNYLLKQDGQCTSAQAEIAFGDTLNLGMDTFPITKWIFTNTAPGCVDYVYTSVVHLIIRTSSARALICNCKRSYGQTEERLSLCQDCDEKNFSHKPKVGPAGKEIDYSKTTIRGPKTRRMLPRLLPRALRAPSDRLIQRLLWCKSFKNIATPAGFEPATFSLEGCQVPLILRAFCRACRRLVARA